jgi:Ca-activated chloride channel family protein
MTAASHAPAGIALHTANDADRIALRGVRLRARVAGMSLKATLEQTIVNLEPKAIEAVYTFPLPESAAVCGFEVVFFDKVFTGVVDETDRAIEKYDDAIAEGHGAYLLEQHRPDVFSVRVGNLKPRQAVTIRITYVADLDVVDRSIRLAFPTTIAPRYATASGTDPIDAAVDSDALNPPHVLSVPYGLSMELEADLGKNLTSIESPSHAIVARRGPREGEAPSEPSSAGMWNVTFAGTLAEMDRDVVLTLHLAREQEPFALAATSAQGERFVALSFLPEFDHDDLTAPGGPSHAETVFVLDCSGSMQGESIAQATAALECCLRAMSAGDPFNVCRFGSTFEMLAPEPLVYSDQTLQHALHFIRRGANLGGTELLAPLDAIFTTPSSLRGSVASSLPPRNLVLLTDGQVTNEPAVIALAKRHRTRNRLFTFGIGHGCSHFLVAGLARATGGAAEFIAPGERIEEKVLRTFGRLASPPVTDVEIDWADADAQVAPRTLPPLFDGDCLRAVARVPGRLPETVTLRCNTPTGPKSWPVRVREAIDAADLLPTLWARSMIRSIEEDDGVQASISRQSASAERAKLIDISKRYNLLCSLTSFVAVEHRSLEDRNEGRPALRRVPLQFVGDFDDRMAASMLHEMATSGSLMGRGFMTPAQFAGRFRAAAGSGPTIDKTLDKTIDRFKCSIDQSADQTFDRSVGATDSGDLTGLADAADGDGGGRVRRRGTGVLGLFKRAAAPPPPATAAPAPAPSQPAGDDALLHILAHQAADGSFDDSATVEQVLRNTPLDRPRAQAAIDQLLHDAHVPAAARPKLGHTLLVLLVLRLAFADRQPLWRRAARKAIRFLTDAGQLQPGRAEAWLTELDRTLAKPV